MFRYTQHGISPGSCTSQTIWNANCVSERESLTPTCFTCGSSRWCKTTKIVDMGVLPRIVQCNLANRPKRADSLALACSNAYAGNMGESGESS
jgi:hypothetical protein